MAYYNNTNNANLYPNFSTSDELDGYPFLGQMSANEEAYTQTHTFPGGWTVGGQPDNVVSSPTSLRAEAGFGKYSRDLPDDWCLTRESPELASSATQVAQTHGYGQPSFPGQYWSMTGPYTQPYCPGIMSRDNSFSGMAGSGASTVVPTPSGGKHLFSDETLRNRVLTDREQPRSATGGTTGAGHPLARFTR